MTHDQQIASDPAISAWVSASAGTGKTKVLTDRVLRLLLGGAEPDKILCITYTKAAAGEMQSRIEAQLARWVKLDDAALETAITDLGCAAPGKTMLARARTLFARVLDAPERIRIQTIHGFCRSILTRFPLEAQVPPHFEAIDDITAAELMAQARMQLLESVQKPENERYAQALGFIAAHVSESSFSELMTQIVKQRRAFAHILAEASDIFEILGVADMDGEKMHEKHFHYSPEQERELRAACAALAQSPKPTDSAMLAALQSWLETRTDAARYAQAFITNDHTLRKTICTKEAANHLPELKDILLAEQQRVFAWSQESRSHFIAAMSERVRLLADFLLGIYQSLKTRRGYLDYEDLIFHTARLLATPDIAPWVLYKLDGGIDHLLIDEAQDTAPEQWQIVETIVSEFFNGESARRTDRTLFVVGDEKQSIFSFQGADPRGFDAMQTKLARLAAQSQKAFSRVRLARSFRSSAPVLQAVDAVFDQPEARAGLIFNEADIRHELHRTGNAGRVEIWPLAELASAQDLPNWHIPETASYHERPELENAVRIAAVIAGWLHEGRMLESKARPVTPGDILILVQRRSGFADILLQTLKRRHIPVAGADRLVLTEHIAVEDCLSLARFLLLPQDDLSLAETLRSPFIGMSEEALFTLCHARGEQALWQRLRGNPAFALETAYLSGLLSVVDYLTPYQLFSRILEEGGRQKLAARLGQEIEDPLNEFLSLALQYATLHPPSLQGFLQWLEEGEIEIKRDMEKGRDEVRILTVHGAKGLQAPIVFLADSARVPTLKNVLHWTKSPAMALWSPGKPYEDAHYRSAKEESRLEMGHEYRRLLYVAMTRAEDELYICGWQGSKPLDSGSWYALISRAAEDWPSLDGKKIVHAPQTVHVEPPPVAQTETGRFSILPEWLKMPAPEEVLPPRPLNPSQFIADAGDVSAFAAQARERGIVIHKLLQYLPEIAPEARPAVMERFLPRYGASLSSEERARVLGEVEAILLHPEFAPVFGPGSVAEVSISGVAEGKNPLVIAGRIDRIALGAQDVFIIDYKTGRRIPRSQAEIPLSALRQMEAYRALVARIYPQKTIHCALLWTAGPELFVLPETLLQSLAA